MNIFQKIGSGVVWVAKEIGKGFTSLPKLITLTDDAKAIASDSVQNIVVVLGDVKDLTTASVKDGGLFVQDLAALGSAILTAAKNDGLNVQADAAVAAAFEKLIGDFQTGNVSDILEAWKALVASAQAFDVQILADLKKLEQDAV